MWCPIFELNSCEVSHSDLDFPYLSTGPPLPKSRFIVAVNWSAILFMDGRDKTILEIPYVEIKKVNKIRYGKLLQIFSLVSHNTVLILF